MAYFVLLYKITPGGAVTGAGVAKLVVAGLAVAGLAVAGGLVGGEVLAGLAVLCAEASPDALGQGEGCFDGHFRCHFEEYLMEVSSNRRLLGSEGHFVKCFVGSLVERFMGQWVR